MFTLFAAQLSVDCFGTCGTSCVRKRSHWICKSTVKSRLVFGAVDLKTSRLRPRQDAYVHHVPQYTSGFHGHIQSQGVTTMGRLANKHILITGGNSGIGLAAAQEFDREGARVAICGLNERTLQATKQTLGAGSLAVRADVSNLPDLDTLFATIKREFGHLDGVFVNAGYSEFRLFEEVTEQSFDKVIAVNFRGPYFTIQKALPLLRQGSSVIINASVGARKGWPTTSTVSTCKAAVVHLARILSAELLGRGIRVNTLSPGPTDTAMFGRFPGEEQGEAVKDVLRTNNPSKRMADPL